VKRALLVFPGRGSLPATDPAARAGADVVSKRIFDLGAQDLDAVREAEAAGSLRIAGVCGLSLGWYTAVYAAGALDLADARRLVETMGAIQVEEGRIGGQVVYPVVADEDWRPDPAREAALERALAESGAARSIRLGGYEVLAGDEEALTKLERLLPIEVRKGQTYPSRLPGHSAFHTPLMAVMAGIGQERLIDLDWRAPRVPLVDGRGAIWRPRSADPGALFDYTLGAQVVEPYDFARGLRTALRELAPDLIVAMGPGDNLGGPIGQVLVREGWEGLHDREAFAARQKGDRPLLLSMGRSSDRQKLRGEVAAP
jgi:[acyl-carrier-protein] S-malonyltransferase